MDKLLQELKFEPTGVETDFTNMFFVVTFSGETASAVHAYDQSGRHWIKAGVSGEKLKEIVTQLKEGGSEDISYAADLMIAAHTQSS